MKEGMESQVIECAILGCEGKSQDDGQWDNSKPSWPDTNTVPIIPSPWIAPIKPCYPDDSSPWIEPTAPWTPPEPYWPPIEPYKPEPVEPWTPWKPEDGTPWPISPVAPVMPTPPRKYRKPRPTRPKKPKKLPPIESETIEFCVRP